MPPEQIRICGIRVLYRNTRIAVEFFHSLTDGYGGLQFLKTMLAEYLRLAKGLEYPADPELLILNKQAVPEEIEDSYAAYAAKRKMKLKHLPSYQMSGKTVKADGVHMTTIIFPLIELLQTAHDYHVTLTTLLTAVMAASIMELQMRQVINGSLKPVRIMVPVNLRKLFPSRSLRNFSLYALPQIKPGDEALPMEALLEIVGGQLKEQLSRDVLQAMISTNVGLERNQLFRRLPLNIKCAGLHMAFRFFGAKNSSISVSNLGRLDFPETIRPFITRAEFFLTPRLCAPYNCGVASYEGQIYINLTRNCTEPELERIFIKRLSELRLVPTVEADGAAT